MKRLSFSKDQGTAFYKDLRTRVDSYFKENELSKAGSKLMTFKIILYFSLVAVTYGALFLMPSYGWFLTMYLIMGLAVLLTAFNVSHDAAHGVAVRSRWWNEVLFQLSFQLQGNNAYVWGTYHNESHHLYTNVEGSDIDVLNNPLVRMTDTQELKWYHRYQYIYTPFLYLFYSLNWFLFRETLMLFNISSRTIKVKLPRKEIGRIIFFKLFYIGYMIVLPALILPYSWGGVILAFVLNHFMVSIIFTAVLGVSHLSDYVIHPKADENGHLDMSWAQLQLQTSVDYNASSVFFNWTLGGFNAHALHHLLPDICHTHYLQILPIFKDCCERHGLTYMDMPYQEALASHFRFLKKMGKSQSIQPKVFAA
jgi:linoleoyl-CoA desaturase